MAGKGIISKTENNTAIFRLVIDGKIMDRIEVDDLFVIPETEMENETEIARRVGENTYE